MQRYWCFLMVVMVIVAGMGCPAGGGGLAPTTASITGTWDVVSTATSPAELEGLVDVFRMELFGDGTGSLVPGSGFDPGFELELVSPIEISYTFNGTNARIRINYTYLFEGMTFSSVHVFNLRVVTSTELAGTRDVSVLAENGDFLSIDYNESWILVGKDTGKGMVTNETHFEN